MEYKGIKLTLDMDSKEFESSLNRVKTETNKFDNDIKKLKQNLKFDGSNVEQYNAMILKLNAKLSETSTVASKLKQFLNEGLDTGKIAMYSKEWIDLTNVIETLNRKTEITKRNIDDLTDEWQRNGKISNSTLKGLNKDLEEQKTIWERLGDKSDLFFSNLKANLVSNVITAGLNLIKKGIDSIWNGLKSLANSYVELMKSGIEYNAQMQGYETTMAAILDDKGAAQKLVKNLRAVGIEFGFDTNNLLEMGQTLLAAGENASDVEQSIKSVVSVLSLMGKGNAELKRVSQNLLQIKQRGTATERDLKEFANNGIPIYKMLADYSKEYADEIKATEVSYKDIVGAIYKATSDVNSIYAQAGEIRQQTFTGQMDRLQAGWQLLWADMAEDTTSTLTTEILPAVNEFMAKMLDAFENGYDGKTGMAAVVEVFKDGIGGLIETLTSSEILTEFLEGANSIVEAICSAFDETTPEGQKNVELLNGLLEKFFGIIGQFIALNEDKFIKLGKFIGGSLINGIAESISEYFKHLGDDMETGAWFNGVYVDTSKYKWDGTPVQRSGGFGALQSGGYGNITLNASFVANGNLDESQALRFASLMAQQINEELGGQL